MKHVATVLIFCLFAAPASAHEHGSSSNQAMLGQLILSHPQSDSEEKARLALDYLEGRGVQQSNIHALKWWLIAQAVERPIERISPETPFLCGYEMAIAESLLSRLEWTMPHDHIAQAKIMAHEWLAVSFK